jgi:hypothetical protein
MSLPSPHGPTNLLSLVHTVYLVRPWSRVLRALYSLWSSRGNADLLRSATAELMLSIILPWSREPTSAWLLWLKGRTSWRMAKPKAWACCSIHCIVCTRSRMQNLFSCQRLSSGLSKFCACAGGWARIRRIASRSRRRESGVIVSSCRQTVLRRLLFRSGISWVILPRSRCAFLNSYGVTGTH